MTEPDCPCAPDCQDCDDIACEQCGDCACTGDGCRSTFHNRNNEETR